MDGPKFHQLDFGPKTSAPGSELNAMPCFLWLRWRYRRDLTDLVGTSNILAEANIGARGTDYGQHPSLKRPPLGRPYFGVDRTLGRPRATPVTDIL